MTEAVHMMKRIEELETALLSEQDSLAHAKTYIAQLEAAAVEEHALIDKLSGLLTRIAAALKGEPPPLTMHDCSDLPAKAAQLHTAVEKIEAEAQRGLSLERNARSALTTIYMLSRRKP